VGDGEFKPFHLESGIESIESAFVGTVVVADGYVPVVTWGFKLASDLISDSEFGEEVEQRFVVALKKEVGGWVSEEVGSEFRRVEVDLCWGLEHYFAGGGALAEQEVGVAEGLEKAISFRFGVRFRRGGDAS
jgi:hypothetical protein